MRSKGANFVWEKLRRANRLPGAFAAYKLATRIVYRDGKIVTLRRGPAAGCRWRHYRCFQPWMAMGLYEPHVATLIDNELKPGDVFYDVGANAGYFALIAAKAVGPGGKVIAFDPNPVNVRSVKEQARLNQLEDVCLVEPLAVSDRRSYLNFVVPKVNANGHLQGAGAPNLEDDGEVIEVETISLDEYVENHPPPTWLKMDIEGAEVLALEGMRKLLSGPHAPRLLISTHSDELERKSKEILEQCGYTFRNLEGFAQMIYALPAGQSG